MTDYLDYLQNALVDNFKRRFMPFSDSYSKYDTMYEGSHGSDRYWLSQIPLYNRIKEMFDNARKAQDTYDNTGRDPYYIDRISGGGSVGLSSTVGKVAKMARSLSDVYGFEIVEDVAGKFNNSYW